MKNKAIVHQNIHTLFVYMTFGELLRRRIKELDISNAEVARRTSLSPTYIGNLVRDHSPNTKKGKGRPSEDAVEVIAKAVEIPLAEARIAAGYAPVDAKPVPYKKTLDALARSGTLSDEDDEFLAGIIEQIEKRNQKTNSL